ncbi:LOW QUALITY PROTEIN: ATP-dependent RNA helicase DDX42-like [Pomacea canaliculata]|uniref:LOW QUALITY PROTEIN: ATP-dependent RNA helicase DDX42-like n=1 Tax=Pomacea canaliculata TaxID=400727 RepID=UPI000D7340CB|nr:LOW QUALITY PROTEIN: ATP-dependent RNA helicase DDX42-like [Pomacea canaliculata]
MYHKGGDGKPKGFGFGGFALKQTGGSSSQSQPLTPASGFAAMAMGMGSTSNRYAPPGRTLGYHTSLGKRRVRSEEEYFEDDEEESEASGNMAYQPAPGSPNAKKKDKEESDDSEDALDAYMADLEKEIEEEKEEEEDGKKKQEKGVRDDIDKEDEMEEYLRYMEENPMAGVIQDEEDDMQYDSDGNPIPSEKSKIIDPLPPLDHSEIEYEPFERNFYEEHEEIKNLTRDKVDDLRRALGIKVSGLDPPKPVSSFAHFGFDEKLLGAIRKSEYSKPTPIQGQGIPIAMSGRDIIGIAKTGSGKTAAFVWPMLIHIMDQKELQPGDGPIGLILAPTRELSQQIYQEAKKFGKVFNIKVVCAYGGGSMWEQTKACQEGAEIIVATPGRLIDLVKKKATNLRRVTYLVFDEADRMFDLGFEPQVRSIANHVRPDRQTLLFSATFRKKVEKLARDILADPIRVVQGEVGEANEDVSQSVEVLPSSGPAKWTWLVRRLVEFTSSGSVLIFVTRKANAEELATQLRARDFPLGLLHGDISQMERNEIISSFKKKEFPILVATDVAARGLDIPHIRTVINYDVARDIDTHTHRIGRTGRAGEKGYAYTLITDKDKEFAPLLVRNLEGANQYAPPALLDLAMQCPWFKKTRFRKGQGKSLGGRELGVKARPGLGSESATRLQDSTSFSSFRRGVGLGGPQSDRLSTMRNAFAAQFKSCFVSAQQEEKKPLTGVILPPVSQKPGEMMEPIHMRPNSSLSESAEAKKKRKSRWD